MTEILGHLRLEADVGRILETCTCIPCMMPFITSQFLCRAKGDRPQVVPEGFEESGLHRTILRTRRRCCFHRGIFSPLCANRGLLIALA